MINKTNGECDTKLCNYPTTRTRFYNGMLLTDEHLRAEQTYFRDALRRLTRHLFGWGVVCGLEVRVKRGMCIEVTPGVAIDCCGNLIEVCKCFKLDLTKECDERYGGDCAPPQQPPAEPFTKYLVLRYVETETDSQPVLTPPDDCALPDDKPSSQASKIREGYCLELWDRCPCAEPKTAEEGLFAALRESAESQPPEEDIGKQLPPPVQPPRPAANILELPYCSPCGCCENAVGLADLRIDCANKRVEIARTCRRTVISPRFLDAVWARVRNDATRKIAGTHPQFAYPATANVVAAAVDHEQGSERLQRLEEEVARITKGPEKGKKGQTPAPAPTPPPPPEKKT